MTESTTSGALHGLRVLNLSPNLVGAFVGQFFADHGADVVLVEPAGGSPLRRTAGWPIWARGARSLVAGLDDPALHAQARRADVLIDTFRPGVLERHGLGHEQLEAENPGLVTLSVTGFGRLGPLAGLKGYEGIVMARIGAYAQFGALVNRSGPAFATAPYCSASAGLAGFTGALAALYERGRSGRGQRVETSLLQAIASHDTWNWMISVVAAKYPDAVKATTVVNRERRLPNSWLSYGLLQGLTKDGRWLQFSQASPKLFKAFLVATDLDDSAWDNAWEDPDLDRREAFWERLLAAVRARTTAEWQAIFDAHPDVFAEIFRAGPELLDHPQLRHDRQTLTVGVPGLGAIRTIAPFIRLSRTPGRGDALPPVLDGDGRAIRAEPAPPPPSDPGAAGSDAPLAGVTIVDIGSFYAAPYGLSILADLGARVIKIEPPGGDTIRHQASFPEIGGIKVMQGKESVAVDLTRPAGQAIFGRLVAKADVVMQNFRAGVAERLGVDEAAVRALKPDIIYHAAPGFGTEGPYARRPAYAPTIGAGAGLALRNIGRSVPGGPDLPLDAVKDGAIRLSTASMMVGHADGFAALGVACAEMLALLAKQRGHGGQGVVTTMLTTLAQVLSEDLVDFPGRPAGPAPDPDLYGLSPLYRLYETADGWVFLAAPQPREWQALAEAMPEAGLDDPRFATAADRAAEAGALADRLGQAFGTRTAREWEARLTAADIACAVVETRPVHEVIMMPGGLGEAMGLVVEAHHGLFETVPRLRAVIDFSRSTTKADGSPLIGEHTGRVLREIGYDNDAVAALLADGVIAVG